MNAHISAMWFRIVTAILTVFGLFFLFFGLSVFADTVPLIPHDVLLPWTSALYGAIMVGWGVTLFFVGGLAFRRKDSQLKRALLAGLGAWLALEGAASAWFGVWFNVGVDIAVFVLFAIPLLRGDGA
jgi:hypothetical protein